MRICHVSPHLPPDQAANALLPAQLGQWMAARGDDVRFVAHEPAQQGPTAQGPGPKDDVQQLSPLGPGPWALGPHLPIQWVPRRERASGIARLLKQDALRVVRAVHRALDESAARADVLHLHSNGLIIEAAASWAARHRKPYVMTMYGTEIWHYKRRWPIDPFTRAYTGASQVTFYSRRLMEEAGDCGLDRGGLSVVYPPVAAMFTEHGAATREAWRRALGIEEPRLLVNVKRLHPLAGQQCLLEAFAEICHGHRDVRLVICGEGPRRAHLEEHARTLHVADRVTFTGLVPNEKVAQYVAAADLFVLPSLLEALPTVAVEALASGTPVLSADHPGGVELSAIFGSDVQVVPRESVPALARALQESLAHPRRTGEQTRESIEQLFRPAAVLKAYDVVYAGALSGASSPTRVPPQSRRRRAAAR